MGTVRGFPTTMLMVPPFPGATTGLEIPERTPLPSSGGRTGYLARTGAAGMRTTRRRKTSRRVVATGAPDAGLGPATRVLRELPGLGQLHQPADPVQRIRPGMAAPAAQEGDAAEQGRGPRASRDLVERPRQGEGPSGEVRRIGVRSILFPAGERGG